MVMREIKAEFKRITELVKRLGKNSYESVELGGREYEVGSHVGSEHPYEILVPHKGTLYFTSLESCVSSLFQLAIGDDWVENILWD